MLDSYAGPGWCAILAKRIHPACLWEDLPYPSSGRGASDNLTLIRNWGWFAVFVRLGCFWLPALSLRALVFISALVDPELQRECPQHHKPPESDAQLFGLFLLSTLVSRFYLFIYLLRIISCFERKAGTEYRLASFCLPSSPSFGPTSLDWPLKPLGGANNHIFCLPSPLDCGKLPLAGMCFSVFCVCISAKLCST